MSPGFVDWFAVPTDILDDPRTVRASIKLKISVAEVVGIFVGMTSNFCRQYEDGVIPEVDLPVLGAYVGRYTECLGPIVEVMIEEGFLLKVAGGYEYTDWRDGPGKRFEKLRAERERKRTERSKNSKKTKIPLGAGSSEDCPRTKNGQGKDRPPLRREEIRVDNRTKKSDALSRSSLDETSFGDELEDCSQGQSLAQSWAEWRLSFDSKFARQMTGKLIQWGPWIQSRINMGEIDPNDVREVLTMAKDDGYWREKLLSPESALKESEGVSWLDRCRASLSDHQNGRHNSKIENRTCSPSAGEARKRAVML